MVLFLTWPNFRFWEKRLTNMKKLFYEGFPPKEEITAVESNFSFSVIVYGGLIILIEFYWKLDFSVLYSDI